VVVNYSKSKEAAEDMVAGLQQNGSPEAVAIQADMRTTRHSRMGWFLKNRYIARLALGP
jgi:hypothetical protein